MHRFTDLFFIAVSSGWKWILGGLIGIAAVVGILFAVGVFDGGPDDGGSRIIAPKPTRSPTHTPVPDTAPTPRPTIAPAATAAPTATPAPTATKAGPTPTAVPPTPRPTATRVVPTSTAVPPTPGPTATPEPPPVLTMQVMAVAAENIGALEFVVVYDPALLELAGVQAGSLASEALVDVSSPAPGRIWTGIVAPEGIDGNGPLTELTFRWLQESDGPVLLTLESVSAYNADTLVDVIPDIVPGQAERTSAMGPVLLFR